MVCQWKTKKIVTSLPATTSMGADEILDLTRSRTHLSLAKDAPIPRPVQPPSCGKVIEIPQVGGLHHRYERRTA
jgi:hypothetical protein